ncbi:CocE/NonD family hydrolase [Conexibacter sp. SYSU D00693]|uniref:CocE/NonD family hydrolase n=1 Tax=Conexibacter sp. SYSU D00693 TaxID=2812560 RepID=UPI00196B5705|nr:CocE/NonD family hydrolase [Conexibacter sp. SYSU D00693]
MASWVKAGVAAVLAALLVPVATAQAFTARGSVEQVAAEGLAPGVSVALVDGAGRTVEQRTANALGATLFRGVEPGHGYRVRAGGEESGALTVLSTASAPPSTKVYDQAIPPDGYGYLTTRDGTKLAYSVHPPTDVTNVLGVDLPGLPVAGPYPTLIEYSGYAYARPSGPASGIATLANLMGFAVVDVNMRGTGCSGGAFDFFEPLQGLDGYDVIETIARQPWVKGGKVGMLGISYGGISQLFTAATQPPSLAAITPLSVIDQTQTTLYPGGILNTGFAFNWAKERAKEALPSGPDAGQPYAAERIAGGDTVCKDNQALHAEAIDLLKKVRDNDHYVPEVADPLAPVTFVDRIKVPTFLACQSTDEQTGGHCPTLFSRLTGTKRKWFTFTNGTHVDSLAPETFNRLLDFLSIYVADQSPAARNLVPRTAAGLVYDTAMGVSGLTLPRDPIQEEPNFAAAKQQFERLDPVRILFDNGAGRAPGQPYPGFERSFRGYPVPGTTAGRWYLTAGGALQPQRARVPRAATFTWDARARPLTNFTGDTGAGTDGLWTATPPYRWEQDPPGSAAGFLTAPLERDTLVVGAGAVKAWVRSSARSVDLQATISEVRPDGKEVFVQGGWLRSRARKLDKAKSTPLAPVLSLRKADVKAMPKGRYVPVTIPLYHQAHAYREGSRIRLRISAPNGDQPIWAFEETLPAGKARVAVGAGGRMTSRLLLPVVPGGAPTPLPPCPGLRGEPCRDQVPFANRTARVRARAISG